MTTLARLVCLAVLVAWGSLAEAARPNILFIVADDLGWRDVGWHGGPFQTPNLDRLVREGVELDRHYVQPSVHRRERPCSRAGGPAGSDLTPCRRRTGACFLWGPRPSRRP